MVAGGRAASPISQTLSCPIWAICLKKQWEIFWLHSRSLTLLGKNLQSSKTLLTSNYAYEYIQNHEGKTRYHKPPLWPLNYSSHFYHSSLMSKCHQFFFSDPLDFHHSQWHPPTLPHLPLTHCCQAVLHSPHLSLALLSKCLHFFCVSFEQKSVKQIQKKLHMKDENIFSFSKLISW